MINPLRSAETIFNGSLVSLMAHTIRSVTNHFKNNGVDLEVRVIADTYDTISLRAPKQGVTSILTTRFKRRTDRSEWDRVTALIFIHKDANKNLARICIAHEVYHLLLELDAYVEARRLSWGGLASSKTVENDCDQFASELCRRHDSFNRDAGIREAHLYFPQGAFDTVLKTHHTESHQEWPKDVRLDPDKPFHQMAPEFREFIKRFQA